MKLFERLTKSKLDEMQEQKLARIERNISHMAIFGLLALFLIELFLFGYDWKIVGGEFVLLMILCFYDIIASLRAGVWSRNIAPTRRNNVLAALAAGLIVFAFFLFMTVRWWDLYPLAGVIAAAISSVATIMLTYFLLWASLREHERRQEQLDQEADEEEKPQPPEHREK